MRARVPLRRIRSLHQVVVDRFPEMVAHEQSGFSAQFKASDQVAQLIDALYLQSGRARAGGTRTAAGLGAGPADRVARWAHDPAGEFAVDCSARSISPRGWVQAIVRAYRATGVVNARN
ncbi:hypothetical protein [Nocardia barduliensis]|uniref:hypothetical protein n=1 Tax=Nocardia barduliensis TaxID=2736643 RepID=UPI0015730E4F|nr:hypothetical protein [Nocardia barduliensis]